MKLREYLNGKELHVIIETLEWSQLGMHRRNYYRWMVQQKGFDKNLKLLKQKKELTTGMLKSFGILMQTFLVYAKAEDGSKKMWIEALIKLFDNAVKEVKKSEVYQTFKDIKIPWNKDIGYDLSKADFSIMDKPETKKIARDYLKKKRGK